MNELPGFSHPAEAQILARVPEAVRDRARAVRMMVFDVDGILTDGSLWYGEHGEAVKPFNALDGHGLRLLREQGIRVAWVSGRKSAITARRAAELGIAPALQGIRDKITLVSTAGTGVRYVTTKSRRNTPDRLVLMKYDRVIRKHVEFKESR